MYGLLLVAVTALGVGYASLPAVATAQRLCENSDSSVANISPCAGPTGTTISMALQRKLTSPPATLLFKRVLANGVPAQVKTSISGLTATTPPQLCAQGGGRWEVWLIDASDKSQGFIGAFWPDCTSTSGVGSSGAGGPGPSSGTASGTSQRLCENSDSAVAFTSPCTGPAGTKINVALRRKLASPPKTLLFKRVLANGVPAQVRANISGLTALTTAQLCTTGGGKWEVWLVDSSGTSQGLIGAFWPQCGVMDPCLVGEWLATSVTPLNKSAAGATGGAGYRVTFKSDGSESIDYSTTTTLVFPDSTPAVPDTFTYRGTASGRISTENGVAKIESVDNQAAVVNVAAAGRNIVQKIPGLGPGGLGSTANNNGYTCAGDSLEYRASEAVDKHPTYFVKLRRQK